MAWTVVFAATKPAVVLLTNAPYLSGEVAAAKASGAVVAEFQHGLFGPRCPEYGWPGSLASRRDAMAVADRLYVFGDLFRGGALKNAFWRADDVRVIGSADIEHLRRSAEAGRRPQRSPRIVFLTQPMTRADAIEFWRWLSEGDRVRRIPQGSLTIKVHPSERRVRPAEYAALAARHPGLCASPARMKTRPMMIEHDLVVSYTSYALIEAVGLGRNAVSISGGKRPAACSRCARFRAPATRSRRFRRPPNWRRGRRAGRATGPPRRSASSHRKRRARWRRRCAMCCAAPCTSAKRKAETPMKNVLVTGADGFIGSHLAEALVRRGHHVRAMVLYNSFDSWGWLDDSPREIQRRHRSGGGRHSRQRLRPHRGEGPGRRACTSRR